MAGPTQNPPARIRSLLVAAALAVLAISSSAVAPQARGAAEPALRTRLAKALKVPHVDQARTGALAVDLATGEVLFSRHAALSLAPASNEKLAVTYALLTTLGPAHRIETWVLGHGALRGTTWRGNIVLKGYGDPSLSTAGLKRLARQLRALGIRRVTGSVVGDESYFDSKRTAPGWKSSFYISESAPLSALTVDRVVYRGRVSANPPLAAASTLRRVLRTSGIEVARRSKVGRARANDVGLARLTSPPLIELLKQVNTESDNFTAEVLLKQLGAIERGKGTTAAGAAVVRSVLEYAEVPLNGARIVDGSGLSRLDRVTVQTLVGILRAAWSDPLLRGTFQSSLAVSGKTGTLERRLRQPGVKGKIFAKTGTTSLSSALSGYVSGRYAFAVVQNGAPVWSWWCQQAQDRFVTVLAVS